MEEKKINKRNDIFILIGIVVFFAIVIGIVNYKVKETSREFDYKSLMKHAVEQINRYQIVCTEKEREGTESKVRCDIGLYVDFTKVDGKDILTPMDQNGFLEYFVLDFEESDKIKVDSVKLYSVMYQEPKDYYKLTKEKNRIIVENKDDRNAGKLYYQEFEDGRSLYLGRDCAKKHRICDDSPMDFILSLDLTVQRNKNNMLSEFDNFGPIYTYACHYDVNGKNKGCENAKFSQERVSIKPLINVEKPQTNENTKQEQETLEQGYNLQPEKEVNIDISNEEEVLTLGERLWKYAYGAYWGTDDVWKRHRSEKPNELGAHYYVCDVTLESVKKKFTEDATFSMDTRQSSFQIEEFLPSYGQECHGAGRGGLQDYKTTTLKIDKIEENEITYIATSEFCNGSFCQNSDDPERQKTVKTVEKPFVIKKVNDEWLIHKYYLPN